MSTKKSKNKKPFLIQKRGKFWAIVSWCSKPSEITWSNDRKQIEKGMRALNAAYKEIFGEKKIKGGAYARRKGHTFEREVAALLRPIFPKVRRQLEFQKECALGIDLAETGQYKFQCKKLKRYAPVATIGEIQCDPELLGDVPVLVTAGDGEPPMAVLPLSDLIRLIKREGDLAGLERLISADPTIRF